MRFLVTGAAGFIGSHVCVKLKSEGHEVVGIDNFSPYYSANLKKERVQILLTNNQIQLIECNILDLESLKSAFEHSKPDIVIHLAAQAGVRLPIEESQKYIDSNVTGFLNVFLACTAHAVKNLLYASSSSVYGDNTPTPYEETWKELNPKSIYGATKLANEVMAPVLAKQLGMRVRAMRFFTVYGPWGRPDMAYFRIAAAALGEGNFTLFGDGSIMRDFTNINDVVQSIFLLARELTGRSLGTHDIVNIGGGRPLSMNFLIETICKHLGSTFTLNHKTEISVDSKITVASSNYLQTLVGKQKFTTLEDGLEEFCYWIKSDSVLPSVKSWINSTS